MPIANCSLHRPQTRADATCAICPRVPRPTFVERPAPCEPGRFLKQISHPDPWDIPGRPRTVGIPSNALVPGSRGRGRPRGEIRYRPDKRRQKTTARTPRHDDRVIRAAPTDSEFAFAVANPLYSGPIRLVHPGSRRRLSLIEQAAAAPIGRWTRPTGRCGGRSGAALAAFRCSAGAAEASVRGSVDAW